MSSILGEEEIDMGSSLMNENNDNAVDDVTILVT
jgi:hypothetical protein